MTLQEIKHIPLLYCLHEVRAVAAEVTGLVAPETLLRGWRWAVARQVSRFSTRVAHTFLLAFAISGEVSRLPTLVA